MNPDTQRPGNHVALLASLYPQAFALAATSNSRFGQTARRHALPALPAGGAGSHQSLANPFQQSTAKGYACTYQLTA